MIKNSANDNSYSSDSGSQWEEGRGGDCGGRGGHGWQIDRKKKAMLGRVGCTLGRWWYVRVNKINQRLSTNGAGQGGQMQKF